MIRFSLQRGSSVRLLALGCALGMGLIEQGCQLPLYSPNDTNKKPRKDSETDEMKPQEKAYRFEGVRCYHKVEKDYKRIVTIGQETAEQASARAAQRGLEAFLEIFDAEAKAEIKSYVTRMTNSSSVTWYFGHPKDVNGSVFHSCRVLFYEGQQLVELTAFKKDHFLTQGNPYSVASYANEKNVKVGIVVTLKNETALTQELCGVSIKEMDFDLIFLDKTEF